jgi:xanthine dehydrogenase accessory factor
MLRAVEGGEAESTSKDLSPTGASPLEVLEAVTAHGRRGIGGVLATVLARHGSTPSTPGQKLFAAEDGTCLGTVGGGAVEREVLAHLAEMLATLGAKHAVKTFRLGPELGMCCGGQVEVLMEPIEALVPCLIVGGGHIATALAPLLAQAGFAVTVVDDREDWGKEGRLEGVRCVHGEFDEAGATLPPEAVVLVMTRDHALDQKAIEWGVRKGFAFVGGVGSRAKAQRTRDRLEAKGFTAADQERIRMPLGIDIQARTPQEIAISIAAEMVAWRRRARPAK